MDQRRYMLFVLMTMAFFLVWVQMAPRMFPGLFPPPPKPEAEELPDNVNEEALLPDNADPANAETAENEPVDPEPAEDPKPQLAQFENKTLVLGELGYDQGYLIQAQINTQGAAIDWVQLTDPRHTTLDREAQLKVVGNLESLPDGLRVPKTYETSIPQINKQLAEHGTSLAEVDWEVVEQTAESITLRYPAPDGDLEVLKKFQLQKADVEQSDDSPTGYLLDVELIIRNLSDKNIETNYTLQGPVGLPLENADNTRSFREIDIATIPDERRPEKTSSLHLTASELIKQHDKAQNGGNPVDSWREPIFYAGLDVQFFSALILPQRDDDNKAKKIFEVVQPLVLLEAEKPERSDFSIVMESTKQTIKSKSEVSHKFQSYFGPKRKQLLEPIGAGDVMRLGWFSAIAKAMLFVLDFFHSVVGLPYAFAIILLTVVVRGMMFPISKKQAIEAEKMKVLAPKLKEIQEKHKDKPEEFAKAYRAFQKKHNYHPMVGCLPALLQLPIFYGLYTSLYQAIDLRLAKFLWIDNLAAPDGLFEFGFTVPWFGFTEFNLLPILTVILFVAQQKLFTPPPTSEEQEMTYKMMNYMMIFIGFMFYRVPAGLCLYFISSSLWGICERTLLKKQVNPDGTVVEDDKDDPPPAAAKEKPEDDPNKPQGFFDRLRQAAEEAKKAADQAQQSAHGSGAAASGGERKYSKKNKKKKR